METTRKHAHDGVNLLLVGNKCDRQDKRVQRLSRDNAKNVLSFLHFQVVDAERAKKLAEKYGLAYFETSAKTGQNVDEAFMHLARDVRKRVHETNEAPDDQPSKGFKIGGSGQQGGGGGGGSPQNPDTPSSCPC